jgi:hypothetical protein
MAEAKSILPSAPGALAPFGMSWPLLIGLLAVVCVLGATKIDVLADPDTYLHIAAGRWMGAHGAVPTAPRRCWRAPTIRCSALAIRTV